MPYRKQFSNYSRINRVIENILDDLIPFLEEQAEQINDMTAIGKALGTGRDQKNLFRMILDVARRFTRADGGTLYLVDHMANTLEFRIMQNDSLSISEQGNNINLPGVRLYNDAGKPNLTNVSSYVFHTGETVNIEDVYKTDKFDFKGTKTFDKQLNYISRSMIVIPMKNHEDEIIGILQLINAKNPQDGSIRPFDSEDQKKAGSLAGQAAVILTQQMLIIEMNELFEAFIKAIAVSIDEKSKHTGGHIQRVTELALMIAEMINTDTTVFKNRHLSRDQLDELRIAALMHDTGKITTPEHIISKSSKLEAVCDRIELVRTRFKLFKAHNELAAAKKKLALHDPEGLKEAYSRIDQTCLEKNAVLDEELKALENINTTKGALDNALLGRLQEIKPKTAIIQDETIPYLMPDEIENLSIKKGTLTQRERDAINCHAIISEKILSKLPWPKKLKKIPSIAGAHHEKLDGTGYPYQIRGDAINLQARILAVADIFEALSAQDRPYKKAMTLNQVESILKQMAGNNEIDSDIVYLFFSTGTHLKYARQYLDPSQID